MTVLCVYFYHDKVKVQIERITLWSDERWSSEWRCLNMCGIPSTIIQVVLFVTEVGLWLLWSYYRGDLTIYVCCYGSVRPVNEMVLK